MKFLESTFLAHYNCQKNHNPSKLFIVADSKINQKFVDVLCDRLNTNADLLYIDTSRRTRKGVLVRHLSYLILAGKALLIENEYDHIIFWQQFIGLYWGGLSYLKRRTKPHASFLPLIYKRRKGIIGKIYKMLYGFSLSSSAIGEAICHSSQEMRYYRRVFSTCASKIFFISYGQTSEAKDRNITLPVETSYFFSGGTSNRDYLTLMSVAEKHKKYNFIIACTPEDVKGMNIPDNVRVFFDAYDEKFDLLIKSSYAVVLGLKSLDISSGQIVLLRAMEIGKPIVATRCSGVTDYIDETCAFLVEPEDVEDMQRVLFHIIENPEEAEVRARRAQKRYKEKYSIQNFASSLAELICHKNRIRLSC